MSGNVRCARVLAGLLILPGVAACGAEAPSAKTPASAPLSAPSVVGAPDTGGAPTTSSPVQPNAAPPAPPPAPADAAAAEEAATGSRATERRAALVDLDRAQRELDAAGGGCEPACRALASMQRATDHLCGLADAPDDRRRCEDARQRLTSATSRVRSACGACR